MHLENCCDKANFYADLYQEAFLMLQQLDETNTAFSKEVFELLNSKVTSYCNKDCVDWNNCLVGRPIDLLNSYKR